MFEKLKVPQYSLRKMILSVDYAIEGLIKYYEKQVDALEQIVNNKNDHAINRKDARDIVIVNGFWKTVNTKEKIKIYNIRINELKEFKDNWNCTDNIALLFFMIENAKRILYPKRKWHLDIAGRMLKVCENKYNEFIYEKLLFYYYLSCCKDNKIKNNVTKYFDDSLNVIEGFENTLRNNLIMYIEDSKKLYNDLEKTFEYSDINSLINSLIGIIPKDNRLKEVKKDTEFFDKQNITKNKFEKSESKITYVRTEEEIELFRYFDLINQTLKKGVILDDEQLKRYKPLLKKNGFSDVVLKQIESDNKNNKLLVLDGKIRRVLEIKNCKEILKRLDNINIEDKENIMLNLRKLYYKMCTEEISLDEMLSSISQLLMINTNNIDEKTEIRSIISDRYYESYNLLCRNDDFPKDKIERCLNELKSNNPNKDINIKKLVKYKKYNMWRLRVNEYRIIYRISNDSIYVYDIIQKKDNQNYDNILAGIVKEEHDTLLNLIQEEYHKTR